MYIEIILLLDITLTYAHRSFALPLHYIDICIYIYVCVCVCVVYRSFALVLYDIYIFGGRLKMLI